MYRTLLVLLTLSLFAGSVLISCTGDEYDQSTRPIDDSEDDHAKNRDAQQRCDAYDFVITDCYDACACCEFDEVGDFGSTMGQCIWYCDGLLLKIDHVEEYSKADIDNYKECVVGCFSICGKDDKDIACWDECKGYLGY